MLIVSPAGQVQHTRPSVRHDVRRPGRREAEAALRTLSEHLESLKDYRTARSLRRARDVLTLVVATAY